MRRHEEQILCILGEAKHPLFPSEITNQLNKRAVAPYTTIEVVMTLTALALHVEPDAQGRWMLKRED